MKVKSESEVAQSCPTPRDPMDCSLPGSSIHGIFQARVLEWGAIAFSKNCPYWTSNIPVLFSFLGCMADKSKYLEIHSNPVSGDSQLKAIVAYMSIFCFFPSKPARSQTYILPQICNLFPTLVNKLTFYFTHLDSLIYVSTVLRVWMQNQFSEPRDCGKCSTEGTTTNALLRTGWTFTTHVIPSVCLVCSDLSEPTSHSSCLQDLFCDSLRIL